MKMNSDTSASFSGYSIRKLSDNSPLDLAELKLRLRSAPDAALLKPLAIEALPLGQGALHQLPELAARFPSAGGRGAIAALTDSVPKRPGQPTLTPPRAHPVGGARVALH